jgi:hypothetical protein
MDAQIDKILIIFGSVIGIIFAGTVYSTYSHKNVETEKTKTLGRRPKSFLTRKQKTRKSRYHSNKLPTIHENQYENSKGGSKSKTVKRK